MKLIEKLTKSGRDFLGVDFPVICGAMTWISGYELVKSVSENGLFPVFAGGNMPPEMFETELDRCISAIKKPFGVNLITIAPNYKAHLEIVKNKNVPVVVFAGSFPRKKDIELMKGSGKKTMSFASTKSIAEQQVKFGVDALILEGSEAGGHIGHVSLTILLQQVLFEVKDVPIFTGGGIAGGKMIAHLLLMGAAGCQMGTRFVMSEECCAHPDFKKAFIKARARQAVATPQYDSRLPVVAVRAIKNSGMDSFNKLQLKLIKKLENQEITRQAAQYEVESFWVGTLAKAVNEGNIDDGSLMAGQSVGLMNKVLPMREIVSGLISETEAELEAVRERM
ncbi:MAG: NAD(P)H-dependent flavin oxidoreductase [Fibrobacterota bacterium]